MKKPLLLLDSVALPTDWPDEKLSSAQSGTIVGELGQKVYET